MIYYSYNDYYENQQNDNNNFAMKYWIKMCKYIYVNKYKFICVKKYWHHFKVISIHLDNKLIQ